MFLLKKVNVLFAFLVMASTWVFQERFLEMLRPRYFVESTCWSMCPCMEELRLRRARIKTILLFKIVNNLVDIPPEPFLIPTGAITRGHNIRFIQPHTQILPLFVKLFLVR
jgi:hypothetical protein